MPERVGGRLRKAGIISLIIYFALCLLVVFIYLMGPPEVWHQWFRIAWGKLTASQDQRRLCNALNRYYKANGEYPPYLLGGDVQELKEHGLSDPLSDEGYMKAYPQWVYFMYSPASAAADPRGLRRMRNIVSSPDDPLVTYYRDLESPYLESRVASGVDDSDFEHSWQPHRHLWEEGLLLTALDRPRYLCGGGVSMGGWFSVEPNCEDDSYERRPGTFAYETSAFAYPVLWTLIWADGSASVLAPHYNEVSGQFGYQRGDFIESIDGTAREAWLWFYGFVSSGDSPEEIPGLDLVDNDDGLIQPDGIPDGIVVLYKLKEGEVIEVVKKYD